jgi:hypothetical protein
MSSIKKEFIFMPTNDKQFERVVVSEYLTRGHPGCVGHVECVPVGWDKFPSMIHNMYTDKQGIPFIPTTKSFALLAYLFSPFLVDSQGLKMTRILSRPMIWSCHC